MTSNLDFYAGSRLLTPVSEIVGLPIDQVNFVTCQLIAILSGPLFRHLLPASPQNATKRHWAEIIFGVLLTYFCFGYQIIFLLVQATLCFLMMGLLPHGLMEKSVFVFSLGTLCLCHIYRQVLDYGGYTLDITGPLMIATQKLSSLGYSIRDGAVKDKTKLTINMQKKAVSELPKPMEFFSYMFSFHNVICGPMVFYNNYIDFIDGSDIRQAFTQRKDQISNGVGEDYALPSPTGAIVKKLLILCSCAVFTVYIIPWYPCSFLLEPEYKNLPYLSRLGYVMMATTLMRQKYYFAWCISELANVSAGLGFLGYNTDSSTNWDQLSNADIWKVETSTSLKVLLDSWNMTTTTWLRHVVYERVTKFRTMAVFLCSALWHGFYPGYYLTFIGGALAIEAGRVLRRRIRPLFHTSQAGVWLYEVITFIGTRISIGYLTFSFVLLELRPSFQVYMDIYFIVHIGTALLLIGNSLPWQSIYGYLVPVRRADRKSHAD